MNEGQQKFQAFILERTEDGRESAMKELLSESFKKQDSGDFDQMYLMAMVPKMVSYVREDKRDEVMEVVQKFGASHVSK